MNRNSIPVFCILLLALLPLSFSALGLPDDQEQEVVINATSSELFLDQGIIIYRGTPQQPAILTQGSLQISGLEITLERRDGEPSRITATGTPARFQQQPELEQGIIYANGNTIVYDNEKQLLTVSEMAEFIQDGNTLSGHRIEYDVQARRANAVSREGEDRVNMTLSPDSI